MCWACSLGCPVMPPDDSGLETLFLCAGGFSRNLQSCIKPQSMPSIDRYSQGDFRFGQPCRTVVVTREPSRGVTESRGAVSAQLMPRRSHRQRAGSHCRSPGVLSARGSVSQMAPSPGGGSAHQPVLTDLRECLAPSWRARSFCPLAPMASTRLAGASTPRGWCLCVRGYV